jgi:hypothetical protein
MNRQIAELEQELANFADNSIEAMTVEDYNALREKLRLLPKVSFSSPFFLSKRSLPLIHSFADTVRNF